MIKTSFKNCLFYC